MSFMWDQCFCFLKEIPIATASVGALAVHKRIPWAKIQWLRAELSFPTFHTLAYYGEGVRKRNMPNQKHVEWLLKGVESWNSRRKAKSFKPDLENADIPRLFVEAGKLDFDYASRVPLENIDLSFANLKNASLSGADLAEFLSRTSTSLLPTSRTLLSVVRTSARRSCSDQSYREPIYLGPIWKKRGMRT